MISIGNIYEYIFAKANTLRAIKYDFVTEITKHQCFGIVRKGFFTNALINEVT